MLPDTVSFAVILFLSSSFRIYASVSLITSHASMYSSRILLSTMSASPFPFLLCLPVSDLGYFQSHAICHCPKDAIISVYLFWHVSFTSNSFTSCWIRISFIISVCHSYSPSSFMHISQYSQIRQQCLHCFFLALNIQCINLFIIPSPYSTSEVASRQLVSSVHLIYLKLILHRIPFHVCRTAASPLSYNS